MDALLMDAWMAGADAVPTIDAASAALARETVRERGAALGMPGAVVEGLAVAASELVHNQLAHARRGQVAIREVARAEIPGLEVVAADLGPGIAHPRLALEGPGPTARSLGAGLSGARRMVHELDVDVRWGQGSCLWARAFAEPVPRRREVGVLGRAFHEERVSGDHAVFARVRDVLVCAVIDGIGHGPLAADASAVAAATTLARIELPPTEILDACDAALQDTRGTVMAVLRLDEATDTLEHAGVGNVTARLEGHRSHRGFLGASATLGARGKRRSPVVETTSVAADEVIVVYTDGLTSRVSLADQPDLLREHPIVIAEHLLQTFARDTDDALVLVAR